MAEKVLTLPDIYDKKKRSEIMSRIHGQGTRPENLVRTNLFKKGFRYRKNVTALPGKPDIVLPKYKAVIFVNGCFWHGHPGCTKSKLPTTHTQFWADKLAANRLRDKKNYNLLRNDGWRIALVWECALVTHDSTVATISELEKWIVSSTPFCEIPHTISC